MQGGTEYAKYKGLTLGTLDATGEFAATDDSGRILQRSDSLEQLVINIAEAYLVVIKKEFDDTNECIDAARALLDYKTKNGI